MKPTATVPCGTCTLCCRSELIVLHPEDGDAIDNFETVVIEHPLKKGEKVFAIKPRENGSTVCRYLGPFGCSVYEKRPAICKEFDCREVSARREQIKQKLKAAGRMDQFEGMKPLIRRGRELQRVRE